MDQELKEYLEARFGDMERRFANMESQLAEVKDETHLTRILAEKLNDKIDLVAEGVQANTEVMHRHREENRQELREFRSVMEASHRHLEGRVSVHDVKLEQLDSRVTFLEARKA